ncbi:hypothetical protein Tco_0148843 [Tanacetum coccineum]
MYNDLTCTSLMALLVEKFNLDTNVQLNLSCKLPSLDTMMKITNDDEVSSFVERACSTNNGMPHLYAIETKQRRQPYQQYCNQVFVAPQQHIGETSSQSSINQIDGQNTVRIIPEPVGIVQAVRLRKMTDIKEGGTEFGMATQEYVRKIIKDASEDDQFTRGPWLSVVKYINAGRSMPTGCFGDIKTFERMGNLESLLP